MAAPVRTSHDRRFAKETIFVCLVRSEEAAWESIFAHYDISQLEPSDEQTVRANLRSCDQRTETAVQPL